MIEWSPNKQQLEDIVTLLKESRDGSTSKHRDIFQKVNEFSGNSDFPNYLLYILNDQRLNEDIRQISGLTLKGFLERSFASIGTMEKEYFKSHIFLSFLDKYVCIRKAISCLVSTYLRIGSIELWPGVLDILVISLDNDISVSMSLDTLNIIIEDSGTVIEDKFFDFVEILAKKLLAYLNSCDFDHETNNNSLMLQVLTTMYTVLENCPEGIYDSIDEVYKCLIKLMNLCKSNRLSEVRYRIGRCWLGAITIKSQACESVAQKLFIFFTENLSTESYQLNFTSAEFFLTIVDNANELICNQNVRNVFQSNLPELLPHLLHFTKLTPFDICGNDTENKTLDSTSSKKNSHLNLELPDESIEEEIMEENTESYNPNWTLRKCCSKIIDKLSTLFPEVVIDSLRPFLETELQDTDWKIKERSILVLGAIGIGSYEYLKPDLGNIVNYIITQLSNQIKFIRAISCWTLSRFTTFIIEDDNNLFRFYLCELLKRLMDKESIVQDSSCAAFNCLLTNESNIKLSPYLQDIFTILSSVFLQYKDTSLLSLYETITLLSENFPEQFENREISSELLISILKRWYELITTTHLNECNEILLRSENLALFDLLSSVLKVSSCLMEGYFSDFFSVSMEIIERNPNEKELICKSLYLISIICQVFPEQIKSNPNKQRLIDIIFRLIEVHNIQNIFEDNSLKQFILAIIGDICVVDTSLLSLHIDFVIELLVTNISFPRTLRRNIKMDKLSVCNNSCWSLGLIAKSFQTKIQSYCTVIMERLVKILTKPKLNKTLAQNISVCIGRVSIACSETVSKYLSKFIKQFSLTVNTMENSIEKQESLYGICQAIIKNPGGILDNNFIYFLDALCEYSDAPSSLEELFNRILLSYKELLTDIWNPWYNSFPQNLQKKMRSRFMHIVTS